MQTTMLLCMLLTCNGLSVLGLSYFGWKNLGVLGKPLKIKLKPNAKRQDVKLFKSSALIYEFKNFSTTYCDPSIEQRWRFDLIKGSIDIASTKRGDAGTYSMEMNKQTERFQVIIEAEVTHAVLSPVCHRGERRVSCSADGDSTQFSWLVDGMPPIANLIADHQTLSLQGETMANLTCTVKNSFSCAQVSAHFLLPCSDMETLCDATKNGSCYGTAGKPMYLQMNIFSITYEMKLINKGAVVWRYRRSKLISALENWYFRVDTNTVVINASQRSDSGVYNIEMYGEESGIRLRHQTVNLTIEAAISSVSITFACLSQWEKRVVCSTNGDALWYNWYLEGRPLNDTEFVADGSQDDHVIILRRNMEESITCTATNHISNASTTQLLTPCIDVPFWPVWAVEMIILMALNATGYCYRRNISQKTAKPEDQSMEVEEHRETEGDQTDEV